MVVTTKDGVKYVLSTGGNGHTYVEFGNEAGMLTCTPCITRGKLLRLKVRKFLADGSLSEEQLITSATPVEKIN